MDLEFELPVLPELYVGQLHHVGHRTGKRAGHRSGRRSHRHPVGEFHQRLSDECAVDPALWELLRAEAGTDGDRVIEAIIRLARPGIQIPDVRIVSRFGTVATCRIRARDVVAVRARPEVISVKAARGLSPGFEPSADPAGLAAAWSERPTDVRRDPGLTLTGAGVAVASVDWGVDVDSAAFRWPAEQGADTDAGGTRFLSLWDQRDQASGPCPSPYGYGTVHDREEIDDALAD